MHAGRRFSAHIFVSFSLFYVFEHTYINTCARLWVYYLFSLFSACRALSARSKSLSFAEKTAFPTNYFLLLNYVCLWMTLHELRMTFQVTFFFVFSNLFCINRSHNFQTHVYNFHCHIKKKKQKNKSGINKNTHIIRFCSLNTISSTQKVYMR